MAQQGEWYYQVMGEIHGPVTSTQLKQATKIGTIERDTLVRRSISGDWVLAERVTGLFETPARVTPSSADVTAEPSSTSTASHSAESVQIHEYDVRPERMPLRSIDRFFFLAVRGTAYVAIAALFVTGFFRTLMILLSEKPRPIKPLSYEEVQKQIADIKSGNVEVVDDERPLTNTILGRPVPSPVRNAMMNTIVYEEVETALELLIDDDVPAAQIYAFVDDMDRFDSNLEKDGGKTRVGDGFGAPHIRAALHFVWAEAAEIRRFHANANELAKNNAIVFDRLTCIAGLFCFVVLVLVILAIERNTRDTH